jgi:hypothetical protein
MPWPTELNQLELVLANIYPREEDGRRIAERAGLDSTAISFDGQSSLNWHAIIRRAVIEEKLKTTIEIIQGEQAGVTVLSEALSPIGTEVVAAAKEVAKQEHTDDDGAGSARWKVIFLFGVIVPLGLFFWFLHKAENYRAWVLENPRFGSIREVVERGEKVEVRWEDWVLRELPTKKDTAAFAFLVLLCQIPQLLPAPLRCRWRW